MHYLTPDFLTNVRIIATRLLIGPHPGIRTASYPDTPGKMDLYHIDISPATTPAPFRKIAQKSDACLLRAV